MTTAAGSGTAPAEGVERARLAGPDADAWRRWGPYLSERAWGTVREDYSPDGRAWEYLPHDHARSRAYRWSEDGLAGICDLEQRLCLAFAFWNGRDPILKERIFGLTGNEGNHGEDAKASPDDVCVRVRNAGPDGATLEVLPTLWFRNTWSWGDAGAVRPSLSTDRDDSIVADHPELGRVRLVGEGHPDLLFCDNETNARRLWGADGAAFPKDAIGDHVVHGMATVNPDRTGTRAAMRYRLTVPAGASAELRLRLSPEDAPALGRSWDETMQRREREADAFYRSLAPAAPPEQARVMRQAFAGMIWGKQFFHLDVERWLDGDPGQPTPAAGRERGRNAAWRHLNTHDVISMPDPWEYPWFAAWDLAFHTVALAHLDPAFAKGQLLLLCREWYMHPNGQLPAYEWAFGDVNPPVHAWAALRVFEIDGSDDFEFLERVMHKLLLNFSWWVNRKDTHGDNVFEGGFLGLDNIGPIDRSSTLPEGIRLEQSDGTAWMAAYCLNLLEMALVLADHDPTYEDLAVKFNERLPFFAEHFTWFLDHKPQYRDVIGHVHQLAGHEGRLLSVVSPARLRRVGAHGRPRRGRRRPVTSARHPVPGRRGRTPPRVR